MCSGRDAFRHGRGAPHPPVLRLLRPQRAPPLTRADGATHSRIHHSMILDSIAARKFQLEIYIFMNHVLAQGAQNLFPLHDVSLVVLNILSSRVYNLLAFGGIRWVAHGASKISTRLFFVMWSAQARSPVRTARSYSLATPRTPRSLRRTAR